MNMSTTDEQRLLPCERWITERDLALRQTHGETRMRAEFNDHYGTIESTADANRAFFEFEAGWQRALAAVSEPAAPVDAQEPAATVLVLNSRIIAHKKLTPGTLLYTLARQAAAGEKT